MGIDKYQQLRCNVDGLIAQVPTVPVRSFVNVVGFTWDTLMVEIMEEVAVMRRLTIVELCGNAQCDFRGQTKVISSECKHLFVAVFCLGNRRLRRRPLSRTREAAAVVEWARRVLPDQEGDSTANQDQWGILVKNYKIIVANDAIDR